MIDLFKTLVWPGADAEQAIIDEFGLTCAYEHLEKFVCGKSSADYEAFINGLFAYLNMEATANMKERLLKVMNHAAQTSIIEGAEQLLLDLKGRGYVFGLVSNFPPFFKERMPYFFSEDGLIKYFDVMVLSCDVEIAKPDARIFQICLDRMGTRPENTIMIGDSLRSDIMPAKSIGLQGILISHQPSDIPYAVVPKLSDALPVVNDFFKRRF